MRTREVNGEILHGSGRRRRAGGDGVYPDAACYAWAWSAVLWALGVAVVVTVFALAFGGCAAPEQALKQARTQGAINAGHVRDRTLPRQARLVAQDNMDAWNAQHYTLTGRFLPDDVLLRKEERLR